MEQKTPDKIIENSRLDKKAEASGASASSPLGQHFGAYAESSVKPLAEKEAAQDTEKDPKKSKTDNPWEKEHKPWASTVDGRFAIRCFSRGVMGAAFFALGGFITTKTMNRYNKNESFSEQWNPLKRDESGKLTPLTAQNNPLRLIAKCVDTVVGKPIEAAFGTEAVTFRTTRAFETTAKQNVSGKIVTLQSPPDGKGLYQIGRSLGNEVVSITFDFAMASMGDALGRNIVGLIDPNVKKEWLKDGKVDFPQLAKDTLKEAWKIISYNQGEDWAVAIPYAYQMKFQRKAIDHVFPGFRFDFDSQSNGASIAVDDKGQRTGDYAVPGALDLQLRFTGYNVGTLMYRETYNNIGRKLGEWKDSGYKMPSIEVSSPMDLMHKIDDGLSDLARYVAKSVIKGTIFMTPSVPFFWMFRTPQSKWRGLAINPDHEVLGADGKTYQKGGVLATTTLDENRNRVYKDNLHAHTTGNTLGDDVLIDNAFRAEQARNVAFASVPDTVGTVFSKDKIRVSQGTVEDPFFNYGKGEQRHHSQMTNGMLDEMLTPLGKLSNIPADHTESKLIKNAAAKMFSGGAHDQANKARKDLSKLNRDYFNAAFAYTPYMFAKAEFANVWDNAHMDMAIYETLDGLLEGKKGKFRTGLHEMGLALRKQLPDKKDWRDIVKQDLEANKKVDIQSMSQSELGPEMIRKRVRQRTSGWGEEEIKRGNTADGVSSQGNTIH